VARLEYALVAEAARLDAGGTVSILGGAFTKLLVAGVPAQAPMSVVGRVTMERGEDPARLRLSLVGPDEAFKVSLDSEVAAPTDEAPPGTTPGTLFVLTTLLPVLKTGLFTVSVRLEDQEPIALRFVVAVNDPPPEA